MAVSRLCSIPDCGKPFRARGWCRAHYMRWLRYRDPLGGGTFEGEPLRFLREVAFVYDGTECLKWPYSTSGDGYGRVKFNGRAASAHRLVCAEVYGDPPTPSHEAAHSCGNGHVGCVAKRHLSWKTPLENSADKVTHGTINQGERSGSAKLTEAQVREIRALNGTMKQTDIGLLYGISGHQVGCIQSFKKWGWLV